MKLQDKNLKELVINAHISANMMNILSMEKYRVAIKKDFDTACWYFDFPSETNNIFIGDGIFDRTLEGYNNTEKIVESYLIHEAAHSIFTSKNLVLLNKKLKEEKLNFKIFNLFEDARIEYKIREIFGFNFNWSDFEAIPEDNKNEKPSTTLFKIIQTEDRYSFDVPYYEKVKSYYDKIVKAKNEDEIIKLMIEWNKDFPNDTEPEFNKNMSQGKGKESQPESEEPSEENGQGKGSKGEDKEKEKDKNKDGNGEDKENSIDEMSDLELAASLQENESLSNEFESNVEVLIGDAKAMFENLEQELAKEDKQQQIKYLNEIEGNDNVQLTSSNTSAMFLDAPFNPQKIYEDKIQNAEERLKRILKSIDIETINSMTHDKQFNIKGVVQAFNGNVSAKPYKKSVEESYEETKKKVFILMDGSGSMDGVPVKNMRTFSVVVNRLASLNLFEGYIGGSKIVGLDAKTQAFQLPVNDGYITSFVADGMGEGIADAITHHSEQMKNSDYVFILTDGQITDKNLNLLKKNFPEIYEKTVAIYMGEQRHANRKKLDKWFKHSIINGKFENIIEEIVLLLEPNSNPSKKLLEMEINSKNTISNAEYIEQTFNINRI